MRDRHLIITIPKTVKWETWLQEARDAEESGGALLYRLGVWGCSFGPLAGQIKVFVVHDGAVRGYHLVENRRELVMNSQGFTCATTGKQWPAGFYLVRRGHFHPLEQPVPMTGFRGFRYCEDFSQS